MATVKKILYIAIIAMFLVSSINMGIPYVNAETEGYLGYTTGNNTRTAISSDRLKVSRFLFTSGNDFWITKMSMKVKTSSDFSGQICGIVYADNGGAVGSLLGYSEAYTLGANHDGYIYNLTMVNNIDLTNNTYYYIGFMLDRTAGYFYDYDNALSTNVVKVKTYAWTIPPYDPFPSSPTNENYYKVCYAYYCKKIADITIAGTYTGDGYVKVDGNLTTIPHTFSWNVNSVHTLEALSPVTITDNVERKVFNSWSDSGAQTHNYTTPQDPITVTANYHTEYKHIINSTLTGGGIATFNGTSISLPYTSAWLDSGTTFRIYGYLSPVDSYAFSTWNLNPSNARNFTVSPNSSMNYTAYYALVSSGSGGGGGTDTMIKPSLLIAGLVIAVFIFFIYLIRKR